MRNFIGRANEKALGTWLSISGVECCGMIRQMTGADAAAIERLLAESRGAGSWFPRNFPATDSSGPWGWVAQEDGEVIGIVVARAAGRDAEILNLAVAPLWRRRGVGRTLMTSALAACEAAGAASAFLEVRESNASARAFYGDLGFIEVGRRRGYYLHPKEDALVLSRSLP
jgi:[ribosomal protein S18]-alanine N-acetyltransferase